MYIISHDGYFSLRQSKIHPGRYEIRARRRADIERAAAGIGSDVATIIETPHADYPFRVEIDPGHLSRFWAWIEDSIGPPSIKDSRDRTIGALGAAVFHAALEIDDRHHLLDSTDENGAAQRDVETMDGSRTIA